MLYSFSPSPPCRKNENILNVLILSTYERSGGAAIAALRLLHAFQKNGVNASMLVRKNLTFGGRRVQKQSLPSIWERLVIATVHNRFSTRNLWAIDTACCGEDITSSEEYQKADVIHLHWINQSFLSFKTLEKIVKSGKKIVWTMHDAWNATGICHLTLECKNHLSECGNCQYLPHPSPSDLSHKVWKKKKALYAAGNIQFVTCSRWLMEEVKRSSLLASQNVTSIPNPLDTNFFMPQNKMLARKMLHLPEEKKLLLFVAQNVNNPYKGMKYLFEAVKKSRRNDITLLMLGNAEGVNFEGIESIALGYLSEQEKIRAAYNAADAFILPSLSENLPNTIMEAMACGTPSVAFRVGGIPEMIDHMENGYLSDFQDSSDLSQGIEYVLKEENAARLSAACREKVIKEYSEKSVVERYLSLYGQK